MKLKDVYQNTEMHLSSIKLTNLHMCNNIEDLKIIDEKLTLEIAEPNEHRIEKKTNVAHCVKNRENVANDIQESERNAENGQIEDNQKINICKNNGIVLECKFGINCRYSHYGKKEDMNVRVFWFFGKPQEC